MLNPAQTPTAILGIRHVGMILLVFLLLYLTVAILLLLGVQENAEMVLAMPLFAGRSVTPELIFSGLLSTIDSWLMLVVTLVGLKSYLPEETVRGLLKKYGFMNVPSVLVLSGAFVAGVLLMQLLMKILIPYITGTDSLISSSREELNELPPSFKFVIAVTAFSITPIAEEFLFRGVIYTSLADTWNKTLAVAASSVAFIALHPANLSSGNALTHIALVVVTLMFALARIMTKGLYVPVMLHAGLNFSAVFLQ